MVDDRRERREGAIVEATLRLMGREGREAITHRRVAEEAGVPVAATTYYFKSKEELLERALLFVGEQGKRRAAELAAEIEGLDKPRQLADAITDFLVEMAADRAFYVGEYELWLEAARRPELRAPAREWCAAEQNAVAAGLKRLGSKQPAIDARLLVAALDGLGEDVITAEDPKAEAEAFRPHFRRLVEGLLGA